MLKFRVVNNPKNDMDKIRALDGAKSLFCDHYSPEFAEFIIDVHKNAF